MLNGYRKYIGAFAGLALALGVVGEGLCKPPNDAAADEQQKPTLSTKSKPQEQSRAPEAHCEGSQPGEQASNCYARRSAVASERQAKAAEETARLAWVQIAAITLSLVFTGWAAWAAAIAARAAQKSATAADKAIDGADAALAHARRTSERELRAYVLIVGMTYEDYGVGRAPYVKLKLKNTGQTPARGLTVKMACSTMTAGSKHRFFFGGPRFVKFDLGGGESHHVDNEKSPSLAFDRFQAMLLGGVECVAAGVVTYKDVFGRTRRTIFRGVLNHDAPENWTGRFRIDERHVGST